MKLSILAPLAAAALTAVAGCSKPDQPAQTGRSTTQPATQPAAHDADNTRRNEGDRQATQTPFDQGESEADRALTQQIRKAVVGDDSLSMNAHNVKIITKDGVVTLRGPVKSEAEKSSVAAKAKQVSGVTRVDNQLEVENKLSQEETP